MRRLEAPQSPVTSKSNDMSPAHIKDLKLNLK